MSQEQIKQINDTLQLIKQFVDSPELTDIRAKQGYDAYKDYITRVFPVFYNDFPTLVEMVIDGKDISFINRMFDALIQIDKGRSKEEVEKKLGEELAEKYLYPKIGRPNKR
jgi:predicted transcriptional regulator